MPCRGECPQLLPQAVGGTAPQPAGRPARIAGGFLNAGTADKVVGLPHSTLQRHPAEHFPGAQPDRQRERLPPSDRPAAAPTPI